MREPGTSQPAAPLLVDLALGRRIEAGLAADLCAFADALATLAPDLGASWVPLDGGGAAVFTGLLGTRAQGWGLHGAVTASEVDRVLAFFDGHGARTEVELCPLASTDLAHELAVRSARLHGFRDVCAVLAPSAPTAETRDRDGDFGLTIDTVTSDDVDAWAAVLLEGFEVDDPAEQATFDRWNRMLATLPNATLLLARIDGVAVGASNVIVHDLPTGRVASLGGTATLPRFRRRGVQGALLGERLRLAASAMCDLAIVTADPGSSSGRNARRAGFTLAYTSVRLAINHA